MKRRHRLLLVLLVLLVSLLPVGVGASESSGGTVVAWGDNTFNQCNVPGGLKAVQISAGFIHTLAIAESGTVLAWGDNTFNQCNVPEGLKAIQIAAGESHSLALKSDGTVVAWGNNSEGQCNVAGLKAVQIAAGPTHSLVIKSDGTVVARGQDGYFGQCDVPEGLKAVQIATGAAHSLALKSDGTVVAWGRNIEGQCDVPGGLKAIQISAGYAYSLALKSDGTVVAWGQNNEGQCNVPTGLTATQIAAGDYHALALKTDGTIAAWGWNEYGQCGVSDGLTATQISGGGYHSLALTPPPTIFTGTPRSGPAPLTVEFTDLTSGATSWTWEFGDGWGSYTQHPSHTYTTPGTYTVILTTYDDVTGTSGVEVATDYITVTAPLQMSSVLNGYTYDNINSVLLDDVTITLSNGTGPITTTASYGGGFYQILDLPAGTYTVKGEKAGYLPSPSYAVQLYPGTVTQKDIALGLSGVAITGTVYDVVTREVLPDAQITVTQGSMTFTDTSTSTGQYAVNGLSRGVTTTLAASLPGYTHAPITYTPTSRTPDTIDLYLIPTTIPYIGTALAGIVTDADTCNAIPHAQVNLPGYSSTTTSPTGYFFFDDIEPGTYNITATASGYLPSSEYTLTLEDGLLGWQHITLTPQPPPAPSSPEFPNFPPHNVKFTVKTLLGTPVPGVTVSAQAIEQTASPNIFERLLGINITTTPITTEIMNGTTDTNGEINFMMVEAIKYRITLTKPDVVDQVIEIYPKDDNYPFIISNGDGGPFLPDYGDPLRDILINVTTTPPGTGISPPGQIHINYTDTTHKTTNLKIQLDQQDIGTSTNNNIIDTHDTSENAANVTHTFTVDNCKGRSYIVRIDATHPDFGTVHRDYAVTFKGRRVPLGPLPESLYVYVAGFGLMLLGGIFGATSATRGMIIISFSGWLFWAFSWLDDLGAIAPVALGLVTTLAVISIITTRYREEGYL